MFCQFGIHVSSLMLKLKMKLQSAQTKSICPLGKRPHVFKDKDKKLKRFYQCLSTLVQKCQRHCP